MPPAPAATGRRNGLSIGQVLQLLKPEFPDVSISKLRFLEAEGLVFPQRTSSGYRIFAAADVERIRYILTAQRDFYYPLRVIKQHLDALSRGLEPPNAPGQRPQVPDVTSPGRESNTERPPLQISRAELLDHSGLDEEQLNQLLGFGLVRTQPGTDFFGSDDMLVAVTVARLAGYGLEPRHLRTVKTAVEREVGLIDHVVTPMRRSRSDTVVERVEEVVTDLSELCLTLHAALMRSALATDGRTSGP
jgi:DNA-binding transcriptional MerR regulator